MVVALNVCTSLRFKTCCFENDWLISQMEYEASTTR